jgi:ArsR family transcriptional regulator, arsenate/arsenite/antimonite-responsive transcriptional repressor
MNNADFVLVFKALADETRLSIVRMLASGELCACKILEHFNITQPTLSYHMKILCDCGLVEGRKSGTWMHYHLNEEHLIAVKLLLDELLRNQREHDHSEVD